MKKVLFVVVVSMVSAFIGAVFAVKWMGNSPNEEVGFSEIALSGNSFVPSQPVMKTSALPEGVDDFVMASAMSTSSVVFIQTTSEYEHRTGGWLDWFFESQPSQQTSAGSGVILSEDGYIVTNNHVIENADKIRVISGKKTFEATLVGRDPSTDLAVIKIEGDDLSAIQLGNSDQVNVGEWVLAVGNPFNLTSTVTAGIVSAKGRNINLLRDKFPIESFIQTDAAINPGNSGGALVNARGELIGINTAILSKTGSYAGYGFAVPVNIVKKVFNDITQYGEVQKAYLGAEYLDIDNDISERFDLEDLSGVIVSDVQSNGAAAKSGVKKGDVLYQINGDQIESRATIEEIVGNMYPGEKVELVLKREGKNITKTITLTNRNGTTGIIKRNFYKSESLKATFEALSEVELDMYAIKSGVKVTAFDRGGFFSQLEIPEDFIITQINNQPIDKPSELVEVLEQVKGRVRIYGIDKRGRKVYYPYYF